MIVVNAVTWDVVLTVVYVVDSGADGDASAGTTITELVTTVSDCPGVGVAPLSQTVDPEVT